jgi:hypothetical protein
MNRVDDFLRELRFRGLRGVVVVGESLRGTNVWIKHSILEAMTDGKSNNSLRSTGPRRMSLRGAGFSMASDVEQESEPVVYQSVESLMEDDFANIDILLTKALAALRSGNIRAARAHIGRARSIALDWI